MNLRDMKKAIFEEQEAAWIHNTLPIIRMIFSKLMLWIFTSMNEPFLILINPHVPQEDLK